MPNSTKDYFFQSVKTQFGSYTKLSHSNSMFDIGDGSCRIYVRYSKVHGPGSTFFGLRQSDLLQLDGHQSFIIFLWPGQAAPLIIPYSSYEKFFREATPASDGQYKVQVYMGQDSTELYIARIGRFNMEGLFGWDVVTQALGNKMDMPELSHSAVQSVLTDIGIRQGYNIWIPANNRNGLDLSICGEVQFQTSLPPAVNAIRDVIEEIDVMWLRPGSAEICAMFEVEHSTTIYSALLRFNDVHLAAPSKEQLFRIVAKEERRAGFVRQLNRPTFQVSGLGKICTFLEYRNIYSWYQRLKQERIEQ